MAHPPSTPPSHPRIGELFAGYGGLGMGVQTVLGGEIAWFSEFDKGPSRILEHRFPGVPNHGDITKIDWSQVEPVDILTGGSPCQDLSHAGKRQGMTEGTRSNLWVAMREAIAQLRPGLVVWENVRGAYSAAADSEVEPCAGCVGDGPGVHLRALGRVLGDLSDLGYDCRWHGLRAADAGAPHGRFRVFVVATDTQGDTGRVAHGNGSAPADAAGRDGAHLTLLPTPAAHEPGGTAEQYHARLAACDGRDSTFLPLSMAVQLLPTPTSADSKASGAAGYNGNEFCTLTDSTVRQSEKWGDYAAAIARWERVLGRPAPGPTVLSKKGTPQLSPMFVEWMMGLPAGWITDVTDITRTEALKALGNGVVPQQCAAALRIMLASEVAA